MKLPTLKRESHTHSYSYKSLIVKSFLTPFVYILICLIGLIGLIYPYQTQAAISNVSRIIPYQGTLTNSSGNYVADGNYSMTFAIYTVSTGGTASWSETQTVAVSSGAFSVNIGSTDINGVNLTLDTPPYYLGIKIGANAEMTPRIQFGFSPFAMTAKSVDVSQWTTSGSNIYNSNSGNVGIGTTGPGAKLDISGAIRFGNDATSCTSGNDGTIRKNGAALEICSNSAWTFLLSVPSGIGKTQADARASCQAIKTAGDSGDGLYWINPGGTAFQAYCDMTLQSGGWTLVMTVNPADGGIVDFTNTGFWKGTSEYGNIASATIRDYKSPAAWNLSATNILIAIYNPSGSLIGWKEWTMSSKTYNSFFTGGDNVTQTSGVTASSIASVYTYEPIIKNGTHLQSNRNINPNNDRIRLGVDAYSTQGDDNQPGLGVLMNEGGGIATKSYRFSDVELWVNSGSNLWCTAPGEGSYKWIGGDAGCGWSCGQCQTTASPGYTNYWIYRIYVK